MARGSKWKTVRTVTAVVLVAALAMTFSACIRGGGTVTTTQTVTPVSTAGLQPMNTTDTIHLTYSVWDDYEMTEFLAEKFHQKYPNITIEVKQLPLDGYTDALAALAANREMPDLYQFLALPGPVNNGWFGDFSEYWFNDPDVAQYFDSLKPSTLIDGKRAFRMVCEYLPCVAFLDRGVFSKLNVPMPDYNWTYEQMLELIKTMTRPDQHIFGYNYYLGPITHAPVVLNDALSEFGWDGEQYHLEGEWADAVNLVADYRRLGYQALQGTDAWAAASGDIDMWPGNSGLVAIQIDAWWTLNNIYMKSEAREKGIDMAPYVVPRGANAKTNHKVAFLDFGAISSGTKYPREAYEALKFMSFDKEAWMYRIEAFQTLTNEAGDKIYDLPNCMPLINDEEVWTAYRKLYPDDPAYDAFFKNSREPVPLGGQGILGFEEWLGEVYNGGDYNGVVGIEGAVFEGAMNANDAAADLNAKGHAYYEQAVNTFYTIYGQP
jgi:multiple sugar transport system substrate-binding protein